MVIKNLRIVTLNGVIENGYLEIVDGIITKVGSNYEGLEAVDGNNQIAMPGFIDIHTHGAVGEDFLTAKIDNYDKLLNYYEKKDYKNLYNEN